ncbi:MAG: hypothetical protein PHD29_02395 [bacterium]|nr:hypothetical protein [bacterium]MDD5353942.1 hypothetical protein [bacterium]MDD5756025.1 hypothetical protein [bacterium]
MIIRWKIESYFDDKHQDRYLVSINGDREDVLRVVGKFEKVCQPPFQLKAARGDYNWGFYLNTSSKETRLEVEKFMKRLSVADAQELPEAKKKTGAPERADNLAREIGGVIKDLSDRGISKAEAKEALKHKNVVLPGDIRMPGQETEEPIPLEVGRIQPMYLKKEKDLPEELLVPKEDEVKVGILYPEGEQENARLFLAGLTDVLKTVKHHPFSLENVFDDNYPLRAQLDLANLVEIYQGFNIEAFLIFIPNYQVFPEARNLAALLKKMPKKRKVLIKAIALSKMALRTTFVSVVVDIALFKGRGIGDFQD